MIPSSSKQWRHALLARGNKQTSRRDGSGWLRRDFAGRILPPIPHTLGIKPWNPVNTLMMAIIATLPFTISALNLVLHLSTIISQKQMQLDRRCVRRPHYQHSRNNIHCVTSTFLAMIPSSSKQWRTRLFGQAKQAKIEPPPASIFVYSE